MYRLKKKKNYITKFSHPTLRISFFYHAFLLRLFYQEFYIYIFFYKFMLNRVKEDEEDSDHSKGP